MLALNTSFSFPSSYVNLCLKTEHRNNYIYVLTVINIIEYRRVYVSCNYPAEVNQVERVSVASFLAAIMRGGAVTTLRALTGLKCTENLSNIDSIYVSRKS